MKNHLASITMCAGLVAAGLFGAIESRGQGAPPAPPGRREHGVAALIARVSCAILTEPMEP